MLCLSGFELYSRWVPLTVDVLKLLLQYNWRQQVIYEAVREFLELLIIGLGPQQIKRITGSPFIPIGKSTMAFLTGQL